MLVSYPSNMNGNTDWKKFEAGMNKLYTNIYHIRWSDGNDIWVANLIGEKALNDFVRKNEKYIISIDKRRF
jgi:hypothetical protein